ncbi:MAG: response regulator [Spirochaetaceae bacterium]|nr:MAG: response regulator [Spirochaetaceae bacterium]
MKRSVPSSSELALLHQVPFGVCVVDQNYEVVLWNRRLEEWTGKLQNEMLGRSLQERFPHLKDKRYLRRLEATLAGGPPSVFSAQLHPYFFPSPLPGGGLRQQQTVVSSLPFSSLNRKALLFTVEDLTVSAQQLERIAGLRREAVKEIEERKRAEQALADEKERFRCLTENSLDLTLAMTEDSAVLYQSPSHKDLLGYDHGELEGTCVVDLLHPQDRSEFCELVSDLLRDRKPRSLICRFRSLQGEYRFMECNFSDLTGHPSLQAIVIHSRDITKRKRAEEELKKAMEIANAATRAKSEFLANMSHEIRTPMNAVLGFAELLDTLVEDPRQKSHVKAIKAGGKALLALIDQVLDLSKIEAGKMELSRQPLDLRSMFTELLEVFSIQVSKKGLSLELEIQPDLPRTMMLDGPRLRQVLYNLMGNAVKFTERGDIRIGVGWRKRSENGKQFELDIAVEDTGIGIPLDEQERIFEAFTQQKTSLAEGFHGTGLGLTISRRFVQLMGGEITVQSRLGRGSVFRILLPNVETAEPACPEERAQEGTPKLPGLRILVVDDTKSNLILVEEFLQGSGAQIVTARNGREALERARERIPDLILMDLRMPGMDGFEAVSILKADTSLNTIPIVAITASATESTRRRAMDVGCDGFLAKPFQRSALCSTIVRFLDSPSTVLGHKVQKKTVMAPAANPPVIPKQRATELLSALEGEPSERWRGLQTRQPIGEVKELAAEIRELGKSFGFLPLQSLGSDLFEATHGFDVERIHDLLGSYPDLLQKVRRMTV